MTMEPQDPDEALSLDELDTLVGGAGEEMIIPPPKNMTTEREAGGS